jgi:hypothetical protein
VSDDLLAKGKQFGDFVAALPQEELDRGNTAGKERGAAEHQQFQDAFKRGDCYLCGEPLTSFAEDKPCAHWLLNPPGFRKRHFALVTERYGYHQLQNYLRWVANEDGFARNINDMPEEGSGKMLEVTIRYKELEWSFSCTANDFRGHGTGAHAKPHYHFQMRDGARIAIRFNDFHVPFSEYDVISIVAERDHPEKIKRHYLGGEGMNTVMNEAVVEHLIDNATTDGGEAIGDLKFDTILEADEGTTISGDDLQKVIDEAREKKVPLASLLRQGRIPNASAKTIVTPGPGVVEQSIRSGREKKRDPGQVQD